MANELNLIVKTTVLDVNDNPVVKDIYEAGRTSVVERVYKKYVVANAVTDQQIVLDSVDALNFLMIKSDQEITLKIGGTDALRAINLKKTLTDDGTVNTKAVFMATLSADTLLYVSNASGSSANIEVILL